MSNSILKTGELKTIKFLVGESITEENLKFIDSFVFPKLSMFMPVGGSCGYAVTPDHSHPAYMFVLSYDSESEVVIEGKRIASLPNTIFALSPEIKHHEVQNYLPPKYCAIFIERDFFEEQFKRYSDELLVFNGLVINIKSHRLELLVRDFMNESQNMHHSKEMLLEALATLLTHEIIRNIVDYSFHKTILSDNMMINESIKFMNIYFEKEITIEVLAKHSKLSKSHFTKLFTQEMQVSPMIYLKNIRLQNAKKMLRTKELNITEVAQKCGFNSTSYFTKLFKEHFSLTPKEFRLKK